jgi:precorrin-2 dehydrogenase/sirohydrochlorin ferrochelatase
MLNEKLYIACLNLSGRKALVVGAGPIAFEKIEGLLACDARVHVVAPQAVAEVRKLSKAHEIAWEERPYRPGDLEGCFLVVAATSDTGLNTQVYRDAEERSMLVNVVDVPALCNFILPAIVRFGPIAIAISTAGASPALAQRMKREIREVFGDEYAELALMLNEVRDWAKATLETYGDRKTFFESIVTGQQDPIALLRAGDRDAVRNLISDAQARALSKVGAHQ